MTDITVIIVTFNNSSTIRDCLVSLQQQSFKSFRVIIVDNHSSDETIAVIESTKPELTYILETIYLDENQGFAGGNHCAFRYASGDFIALLNPDAFPEPDWLEELMRAIDSEPVIGICASRMLSDSTHVTDSAGDGFAAWLKGFKRGEGEGADVYDEPGYVFGACAGAALYRRAMLDAIGFLDKDFFLFHEDTDLNFRARLAGWKVRYVPTAVVHHRVRHSVGDGSVTANYYSLRNVELVRIKNVPAALFFRYLPVLLVYEVLEFFFFALRHRSLAVYVRAKIDVLRMTPAMWKKRSAIQKSRSISIKELRSSFTSLLDKRSLLAKSRRMIFD